MFKVNLVKKVNMFFIVNFEHISHIVLVFLLLSLSRQMPARKAFQIWRENEAYLEPYQTYIVDLFSENR